MKEVFIYDSVRTPRGRGRKDGSLHEVTALALSTTVLNNIKKGDLKKNGTVINPDIMKKVYIDK